MKYEQGLLRGYEMEVAFIKSNDWLPIRCLNLGSESFVIIRLAWVNFHRKIDTIQSEPEKASTG